MNLHSLLPLGKPTKIAFIVIAVALSLWLLYSAGVAYHMNQLRFSNTMSWDPAVVAEMQQPIYFAPEWNDSIWLPPPPGNTSPTTKSELAELEADKALRTPEKMEQILRERGLYDGIMGGRRIGEYFDADRYPLTAALLQKGLEDVTNVALHVKQQYDRVRPSFLNPAIAPAITIPGHPAYPSAHSTQTHFLAYVIGQLIPAKQEELIHDADGIAKNREIAGVHYPSDTQGGVSLAKQYFDLLMKNQKFLSMLEAAKSEWR